MASGLPIPSSVYRALSGPGGYRTDYIGPICLLALSAIGLFFIYSAQLYGGAGSFWLRQFFWLGIGALSYLVISLVDYRLWFVNAHWVYLAGICLLLLLWTPLGAVRNGARGWLDFGILSVQPAESAKLGTLILASSILARSRLGSVKASLKTLGAIAAISAIPIVLIFAQPDLGSALIFPPMVFALLYVSRLSERFFIAVFACFLLGIGIVGADLYRYSAFLREHNLHAWENRGIYEQHSPLPLKDYQRNRILAFVSPETVDPSGTGVSWNLRQSLQAVGTGGLTGKGWTEGTQAKLGYLPRTVAHNDFIFSVLAEEKGFLGGLTVIGLYAILLLNCVRIAGLARDRFGMLLCVGAAVIFMVHTFINIGMTIGLMPITGLPLPFISYGGSFILSCSILMGLTQSVYRFRKAGA